MLFITHFISMCTYIHTHIQLIHVVCISGLFFFSLFYCWVEYSSIWLHQPVYPFFCWVIWVIFLAIMSKVAINIHFQVFLKTSVFISLGKYLGVELLGHGIVYGFYPPWNLSSGFLISSILMDMKRYRIMLLTCVSLITEDVGHLFHMPVGHSNNFFCEVYKL